MLINPEKLIPPKVALILLILSITLDVMINPQRMIGTHYIWSGGILFILGFSLTAWAHNYFKKHGTPVKHSEQPTAFVASGPYQYSRNPMYVGVLIMFSGLAIILGTWPYFLFPFLMFLGSTIYLYPLGRKEDGKPFRKGFCQLPQKDKALALILNQLALKAF